MKSIMWFVFGIIVGIILNEVGADGMTRMVNKGVDQVRETAKEAAK